MEIIYYNGRSNIDYSAPNFGDELNLWLWPKIFPDLLNKHHDILFIGIGTLLNIKLVARLPKDKLKIVVGTGVGYGTPPILDDTWKIYSVRGILSAKSLNIPLELGIADPAILLGSLVQPTTKKYSFSYVPHYLEAIINGKSLQAICQDLDIHYIDPTHDIDQVIENINATKILFAEAMHGAIVADTLRIPWIPVKTHARILEFKWCDWLSTTNLRYVPYRIYRKSSKLEQASFLKQIDYQLTKLQFFKLKRQQPYLSNDQCHRQLLNRMNCIITQINHDFF